ncbi:MAG: hypothetical protein II375_01650 [Bacteroidales bacterium]|nr:hypothetical protein [Bacteroidales bacterium]
MEDIIEYFTDIFHLERHVELPLGIVERLNSLDRAQRGELKSRLFTEAKRLGVGGDGVRAIRWLETTFEQIEKYSFRLHEVLFSPGQDIPENISFYLSQAKRTVDLCVFTISDDVLSGCLKAISERGVKIRIITDNNKMRDSGSQVKELARCGIEVKVDNSRYHMHNKFGIIDGRIAFTGSYNWTYTAKLHNQENLVITTNFTIVHRFIDEFDTLWQQMFRLNVKAGRNGQLKASVKLGNGKTYEEEEYAQACPADDDDDMPHVSPAEYGKRRKKSRTKPNAGGQGFNQRQPKAGRRGPKR